MSTGPGRFRRNREEADPEPTEAEATTDSTEEMVPAEEAEPTTAMGDCAICHQPIMSVQDYVTAAYGVVHSEGCAQQTLRK